MKTVYILRTKGTSKIPDYLQIRNEQFVLLCHSRADKPQVAIQAAGLGEYSQKLIAKINGIRYGELTKIEL